MIIDTHAHLQTEAFKQDRDQIIGRTLADNIWMINVGTKFQTSQDAILLAQKYDTGVFASIGLHPMHASGEFIKLRHDPDEEAEMLLETNFNKEKYLALAKQASSKLVAIGEIGLDYYYKPKTTAKLQEFKEHQKKVFIEQLDLAQELNLPVILHCRMAHDDVIEILQKRGNDKGVVHCFTGTLEQARKYVALGFYLGINGIIFKFNIEEVIKEIPLEQLVVETDCPYLTPTPEGDKRNEPIFIKHTIQKIADIKGITFEEVAEKTTENARKLFKI